MNKKRFGNEIFYQLRFGLPYWFITLIFSMLPESGPSARLRGFFVGLVLPGRPKGLMIGKDVTLLSINRLCVGCDVYIAKGTWINAIGGVVIEDEVVIAPYVVMSSNNHGFLEGSVQRGGAHPAPIKICFGSWLAAHVVVTAGVTVGKGNLVSANSVVTRSTTPNVVVGGVPASILKDRIDNPSEIFSKHDVVGADDE